MILISILDHYMPDLGDLFLLIISVLLGFIVSYSKQQVNKIDSLIKDNSAEHSRITNRLHDVDSWTHAIHESVIMPTYHKSEENEDRISKIEPVLQDHEKRITKIEKKK